MPSRWVRFLILDRINIDAAHGREDVEYESSYIASLSLLLERYSANGPGMRFQEWRRISAQPIHEFGRFVLIAGHKTLWVCRELHYVMPLDPSNSLHCIK
mmetsp:Transcript_2969/g.6030  ORF Transcript_2969/g.6030 Transcript_2969/m.6030 type:complete len:100 (-) Transcript_2969:262-561(-)